MESLEMRRGQASALPGAGFPTRKPSEQRRVVSGLSPTSSIAAILAVAAVYAAPCMAGTVQQLTDQKATLFGTGFPSSLAATSLDDAGTAVYVNAGTNQLGGNPEHRFQIFRFDAVTGAGQQITSFSKGVSNSPQTVSVSDDGQWVAFVSRADPTGQNHDASPEVFVMHPDGTGIAQVTNDPSVTAPGVIAAVLSGSGNRVLFSSKGNPLGMNPSNRTQIFVVDIDGTGLRQLTSITTNTSPSGISISDDGQRIVFATTANLTGGNADGGTEVYAIQADGTNLRQITSVSSSISQLPVISGDGSTIAFHRGSFNTFQIYAINWDGTGFCQLTFASSPSTSPSITDDGQFVFFTSVGLDTGKSEIWKVKTDATGLTQLTSAAGAPLDLPVVAGGGGRVAFAGMVPVSSFSNHTSGALEVMTGSGTNRVSLVTMTAWNIHAPAITRDGTRIVFDSNMDPFGTNPDGGLEIFRIQADGTGLAQVTNGASGDSTNPTVTADGNTIVFSSTADLAGQNPNFETQVFRVNADGTGVQRLTQASGSYVVGPKISANGSVVVYFRSNPQDIGKVYANGTGEWPLTVGNTGSWNPSVDDTGTWIAFACGTNLTGQNPNGTSQIYRMRIDGTGLQRVSTDNTRNDFEPQISGTGTRIVYFGNADPVGSNPNHVPQIFTYDATTSQTYQITAGTAVGNAAFPPSISGDGNWVVFLASTPWAEPNPNLYLHLYRVPATGGTLERIGAGPTTAPGGATGSGFAYSYKPRTDMTGTRTVFAAVDDPTGQNPDYSFDLWMVDMAREPAIRVSPTAPTLVSWDYEAGPIRYDVIRGDVANLVPGLPGTVDLGPVVCLENDSPDADIRGFEDAVTPPAGHAFFFLFRGSRGLNFGAGSWGQASGGLERVPGSGVCGP